MATVGEDFGDWVNGSADGARLKRSKRFVRLVFLFFAILLIWAIWRCLMKCRPAPARWCRPPRNR
jgi:hypothetical protein